MKDASKRTTRRLPKVDVPFQNEEQKRVVERAAASEGLNVATYMRRVVLKAAGYQLGDAAAA